MNLTHTVINSFFNFFTIRKTYEINHRPKFDDKMFRNASTRFILFCLLQIDRIILIVLVKRDTCNP